MPHDSVVRVALAVAAALAAPRAAGAATIAADPSTYRDALLVLAPGDVLELAPGTYTRGLPVAGVAGTADAWITIRGPATGDPAVFLADPGPCCNIVEISDASYVAIEHLVIDGDHVDGAFGVSAKDGAVHDVRIEGCTFRNLATSQQNVAISTKLPTWGWVIRGNHILDAGTGLYLGNSDGSDPFVGGVIEGNVVEHTIGYGLEIKFQAARPATPGMPAGPSRTIIRHNVFLKDDQPSPDGDRPNVLVGGFPASGDGSEDRYEIYGNLFVHNPRESLLQASGRVTIHDNVFVDVAGAAVRLQDHDLPLVGAQVYDNTIYAAGTGVAIAAAPPEGVNVVGNLIFATAAIGGGAAAVATVRDNLTDTVANAPGYVAAPSVTLGEMDFYPRPGQAQGAPIDMAPFAGDTDEGVDYNGTPRGDFVFRGAYAGEGTNPGCPLALDTTCTPPVSTDGAAEAPAGGCCGASGGSSGGGALLALALAGAGARRRRRAVARGVPSGSVDP